MGANRNDPCRCGSGKKYKACCATRRTTSQWLAILSVVLFAMIAVWVVAGVFRRAAREDVTAAPPSRVWSAEHGHWHDAPGVAGAPQPLGPAPPGKVWSEEHGHWHDATAVEPPGPAPPGKVWSVEHGHWHDVDSGAAVAEPPAVEATDLPEESVSYADEP